MEYRCEDVVIQLIVRGYNEEGKPVTENVTDPIKVLSGEANFPKEFVDMVMKKLIKDYNG